MAGWHHRCNGRELGQLQEMVRVRENWRAAIQQVTTHDWTTEQQQQHVGS